MLKIFVVQCHPRNIFNIELFPNYGICHMAVCSIRVTHAKHVIHQLSVLGLMWFFGNSGLSALPKNQQIFPCIVVCLHYLIRCYRPQSLNFIYIYIYIYIYLYIFVYIFIFIYLYIYLYICLLCSVFYHTI